MPRARTISCVILLWCGPMAHAQQDREGLSPCAFTSKDEWMLRQGASLDDSWREWTDDALRADLVQAVGLDTRRPLPPQFGRQQPDDAAVASDFQMVLRLKEIVRRPGNAFPTKSTVGAAGMRAIWLLAMRDSMLSRLVLEKLRPAGAAEVNVADLAVLEDRVRVQSGQRQLYGTQFSRRHVLAAAIEDSAHVDDRRRAVGLPDFHFSTCF